MDADWNDLLARLPSLAEEVPSEYVPGCGRKGGYGDQDYTDWIVLVSVTMVLRFAALQSNPCSFAPAKSAR